jgi:hypothetical protein
MSFYDVLIVLVVCGIVGKGVMRFHVLTRKDV